MRIFPVALAAVAAAAASSAPEGGGKASESLVAVRGIRGGRAQAAVAAAAASHRVADEGPRLTDDGLEAIIAGEDRLANELPSRDEDEEWDEPRLRDRDHDRDLQDVDVDKSHYPLPCNAGVESLDTSQCVPLSSFSVPSPSSVTPLTIPCGTCAIVDVDDGSVLDVPSGMRVEGRLLFPPSASLTVRTTHVLVLGLLEIQAPAGAENRVIISLHGEDDIYFRPHPDMPNPDACDPTAGCKIGSKVIAVAGGRVDIRGLSDPACPAWEKVLDVSRSDSAAPSSLPSSIPSANPTPLPSLAPSAGPSPLPSDGPSYLPSSVPSAPPSALPTEVPLVLGGGQGQGPCVTDGLVPNGGFEEGTPHPFVPSRSSVRLNLVGCEGAGAGGSFSCALAVKGRYWSDSAKAEVSPDCFSTLPGVEWKLSYDVRVYEEDTGAAAACPGYSIYCPFVRVWSWDSAGKKRIDNIFPDNKHSDWKVDDDDGTGEVPWNRFEAIIHEVPAHWIGAQKIEVTLVGAPQVWTIREHDNVVFAPIVPTPTPPPVPTPVDPVAVNCAGNIVANGDFKGNTYSPFFSPRSGVQLSLEDCHQGDCSLRVDKDYWSDGPIQELPLSCLSGTSAVGSEWWLRFDVKVAHEDGTAADCTSGGHLCPMVRMWVWDSQGDSKKIDNVLPSGHPWPGGWKMPGSGGAAETNRFDGVVEVGQHYADSSKVELRIDGGPEGRHSVWIDNVALVPYVPCDGNLVVNGEFKGGTSVPFVVRSGLAQHLIDCEGGDENGDCALRTEKPFWHDGPVQQINLRCFGSAGQAWEISFDVKLTDLDGMPLTCAGAIWCPMVRLWIWDADGNLLPIEDIYADWSDWTTDPMSYNHFHAIVEAEEHWAGASKVELHVVGGPNDWHSSIVDNVSLMAVPSPTTTPPQPTPEPEPPVFEVDCGVGLIANGEIAFGTYAPFFPSQDLMDFSHFLLVDCAGDDCSLRSENDFWFQGIAQEVPPQCFTNAAQEWTIRYDVKLLDRVTGNPLPCEGNIRCPMVRAESEDSSGAGHMDNFYADDWSGWTTAAGEWNHFEATIATEPHWIGAGYVRFRFEGGPDAPYFSIIDNVQIIPGPIPDPEPRPPLPPDQILVSPQAAACWSPGSELLITTNTDTSQDYHLVTVQSADPSTGLITLAEDLVAADDVPLSTMANDPRQAVEVASLNRPVVFEAEDSPDDDLIGGHLIFYNTPGVTQHMEGVEIRNFGQAGRLGRYPVHFHLCEDAAGSVVRKTVVRQSNQRCYVVHGSQYVKLEENVAFDNFGHCYMTEDGSEHSNEFLRNLGAHTKVSPRLIDSDREETDDSPGIFWMTNMQNSFEGNVMAGSEFYGFFVEGHRKIRGPSRYQDPDLNPMLTTPTLFKDNIIHGQARFGMTTYPKGWVPPQPAVLENLQVYRGKTSGMFIHNSGNLQFQGGYFLNHRKDGIEMDGADQLVVNGTTIVDRTASDRNGACYGSNRRGIVVHPVKQTRLNTTIRGTSLINVDMMEFGKHRCDTWGGHPLQLGDSFMIDRPVWDISTLFKNVSLDLTGDDQHPNELIPIDGCLAAEEVNIRDVSIEVTNDIARVFTPEGNEGFIVSPSIAALLDHAVCIDIGGCLKFCQDTCLRTILFHTDVTFESNMVVEDTNDPTRQYTFTSVELMGSTFTYTSAYFGVSLPGGSASFDVSFHDPITNELVFPSFVAPVMQPAPVSCDLYATESSFNIVEPSPTRPGCLDLIRNGNFDTSVDDFLNINAPITWSATGGVDGGAISYDHTSINSGISQWIDVSCLVAGDTYEFEASYRLVNSATGLNVDETHCLSLPHTCMHAWVEFRENDNSDMGDIVHSMRQTLGRPVEPLLVEGSTNFGLVKGTWTVTSDQASDRANRAVMHINNAQGGGGGVIIDQISLTRM